MLLNSGSLRRPMLIGHLSRRGNVGDTPSEVEDHEQSPATLILSSDGIRAILRSPNAVGFGNGLIDVVGLYAAPLEFLPDSSADDGASDG